MRDFVIMAGALTLASLAALALGHAEGPGFGFLEITGLSGLFWVTLIGAVVLATRRS